MLKTRTIVTLGVVTTLLLLPMLVFAQSLVPATSPFGDTALTLDEIETIVSNVANTIIVIGVVMAVISIVVGGIMYATAGGNDEKVGKAKKWLYNGIIAALIVFGVGVLLNTARGIVARTFF